MQMNKSIVSLRDLKVAVIEEIQCLVQELKNIHLNLPVSKHLPIPQIPMIHPEEVPEKRFQYNDDILLAFKQEQTKKKEEKSISSEHTLVSSPEEKIFKLAHGRDGEVTTRDSLLRASKGSIFNIDVPKVVEFEPVESTDIELEIMKRDEIKHIYTQQYLLNRVRAENVAI